jgi:hypothetical protein
MSDPIVVEKEELVQGEAEKVTDYRFCIAIVATFGYLTMLILTILIQTHTGGTIALFEKVAATISGPIGAIWGYYFGAKSAKPE